MVTPLLLEDFYLIQPGRKSSSKPLPIEELVKVTLILPRKENVFRRVIDAAAQNENIELDVLMEIDSISALKQLVEIGKAFTILPFGAVHREVREGTLSARRIKSIEMRAMLVTAMPLHRPISKTAKALVQLVHEEVKRCVKARILRGQTAALTLKAATNV